MDDSGYLRLVYEILMITHYDLQVRARKGGRHYRHRQDALAFLESDWFDTLCHAGGLDTSRVKGSMLQTLPHHEKQARSI